MLVEVVFYLCICEYFEQAMCWDKHTLQVPVLPACACPPGKVWGGGVCACIELSSLTNRV